MDFMNLAEVPEVDFVQDGDTVFVVRDGEVRRVAKDKVGGGAGAGGYLLEIPVEDMQTVSGSDEIFVTTNIDEMLAVVNAGGSVVIKTDGSIIDASLAGLPIVSTALVTTGDAAAAEGVAATALIMVGFQLFFTNGQPIPDIASVSTLRSKLGGGKSVKL